MSAQSRRAIAATRSLLATLRDMASGKVALQVRLVALSLLFRLLRWPIERLSAPLRSCCANCAVGFATLRNVNIHCFRSAELGLRRSIVSCCAPSTCLPCLSRVCHDEFVGSTLLSFFRQVRVLNPSRFLVFPGRRQGGRRAGLGRDQRAAGAAAQGLDCGVDACPSSRIVGVPPAL